MQREWLGIVLLAAGLAGMPGHTVPADTRRENSMEDSELIKLLQEVDRTDELTAMRLLSRTEEERHRLLGTLLTQLGTSSSKKVQIAAVYLIGAHRLQDGVRDLVKWIDLDAGELRPSKHREPLWDRYPAMEALIRIGKPSVRPAMDLLSREEDALRRDLAVKVIRYVEGSAVADFILSRAASLEKDRQLKRRWTDALDRLRQLPQ